MCFAAGRRYFLRLAISENAKNNCADQEQTCDKGDSNSNNAHGEVLFCFRGL